MAAEWKQSMARIGIDARTVQATHALKMKERKTNRDHSQITQFTKQVSAIQRI